MNRTQNLKAVFKFIASFQIAFFLTGSIPSNASLIIKTNPFADADQNGLSPFWDWRVFESEHFRLTFPKELAPIARTSIEHFENAHRILSPVFRWKPYYKASILLIDNTDSANGLASPIGRYGIVLWVTPPDSWFSTNYYDDWLKNLIYHEYTHFLNMDTTEDFWVPLRYLFGDTFLPNALWPPWMLEGLAVYMETQFTHAGRGRSPYYQMVLRAAVEAGVLDSPDFITLDKINGYNPYFPKGDTRYQFGYHLMNQLSEEKLDGHTFDHQSPTVGGTDLLGQMSQRSGSRIPYFINNNLENISGKNWYDLWNKWVESARARASNELKLIQSQPTTTYKVITEVTHEASNEVIGPASSPDGKWLAYTLASSDRRQGIYLRNLETGVTRRLYDKLHGIGISFTPDSKSIIWSELNRRDNFYLLSDLKVYSIEDDSTYDLTRKLRARDPSVSQDGKWITFTITEPGVTGLALAPLIQVEGKYELGPIKKLFMPHMYDRVSNPRFYPDGKKIIFSLHTNGKSQEDLVEFDLSEGKLSTLDSDGKYNNYPIFDSFGNLYYVSNLTGVDNIYRYFPDQKKSKQITNMTTGIGFPTFVNQKGQSLLYASVFSYTGWNLALIDLPKEYIVSNRVTLPAPPAPAEIKDLFQSKPNIVYEERNYSIYPSILPRAWTPLFGADSSGISVGGQILGFDNTNRHRYLAAGTYTSNLKVGDGYFLYSNRTLGPALNFSTDILTKNVSESSTFTNYSRQVDFSAEAAYPIQWTYSSLTPSIALNAQRIFNYRLDTTTSNSNLTDTSALVPNFDALMTYSSLETSNLAISPEGGRYTQFGSRYYFKSSDPVWKFLFTDQEYLRLSKHTILVPSFKGLWVSHTSSDYLTANSVLSGRTLQQLIGPFSGDDFDQLSIRGYPGRSFISKSALVAGLDLRFPIVRLFRGWGTNPFFLDNLYGLAFVEASYFPYSLSNTVLPSTGTGLRLSTEILYVPVTFSLEYQYGFQQNKGGTSDFFFQILTTGFRF